ncbi:MAG TPA: VOC family protein [Caulobacteraceae bacterium]
MQPLEPEVEFDPRYWQWGTQDPGPRLLHTMIRVTNLEASLAFYTVGFGMKVLDRFDVPLRRVSAAYIGYADYDAGGLLELTHKWDDLEIVPGSFHFAIGVPDMEGVLVRLTAAGAEIDLKPTVLVPGGPLVAFVKDPDGYSVELIQTRRAT